MIITMFNLKNKKIAVFGLGVSGISAIRFLFALGHECVVINSGAVASWAKSPGVLDYLDLASCFSEDDQKCKELLSHIDLVILSPGIRRDHPLLKDVIEKKIPVWGELELAYRYLESEKMLCPIIGITGTNGKTTTTTFLGKMIEADHKLVFVGGNIGVPFCDYAFELKTKGRSTIVDYILLELSSFQLESIDHFHVNIALFLNLFQNHGERYVTIEDYTLAKTHITNRFSANDVLIYPEDFHMIHSWALKVPGKKRVINTQNPKIDFDLKKFKLPGIHNIVNLNFILEVAAELKLKKEIIQQTIDAFPGVHHRIEYVESIVGLPHTRAYNDAKSTNWDATLTAVSAMKDIPGELYLIIGGKKRGTGDSISPYLEFLKAKVHSVYLIGEMALEIESEIKGKIDYKLTRTLENTIADLRMLDLKSPSILLFSPGFPSFDQFSHYAHRGEHFVKLLQKMN
jgi:UDP-N-acetylmuramoylalanine--D-glutamate ligase